MILSTPAGALQEGDSSPLVLGGSEISLSVQETLMRLQDQWLQWDSAFRQGDQERAELAVNDMLAVAEELGMSRLPDLCLGILVRAVEAAESQEVKGESSWALEMAERLDPSRAEIAFARSRIATLSHSYLTALGFYLLGYVRLLGQALERTLWLQDLLLWALSVLLLVGGFYVVLQMANKGGDLYRDLLGLLRRFLPDALVHLVALSLLVWPFLLPKGWVWLVLYWLALLWGYGSKGERWLAVCVLLLFAATPILVTLQQRWAAVALSQEMQVVENLTQERLYGGMFRDLRRLRATLPDSRAVEQLIADVHRSLGQVELALPAYLRVIAAEPQNGAALVNLGVLHYHRREYFKALDRFRQAGGVDSTAAASFYNQAQTYRALLEFDEADDLLAQAGVSDQDQVRDWIAASTPVVTLNGGFDRRAEIRRELLDTWHNQEPRSEQALPIGGFLPAFPALGALGMALVLHLVRSGSGYSRSFQERKHRAGPGWAAVFVPGLASAQAGEGTRAFLALVIPVAALLVPLRSALGYRIPWGYDPGRALPWVLSGLVLVLFLLVRVVGQARQAIGRRRS